MRTGFVAHIFVELLPNEVQGFLRQNHIDTALLTETSFTYANGIIWRAEPTI